MSELQEERSWLTRALVAVEPHRPPMIKVGTETAFRHDHCKHFQKSKHLQILESEVSWWAHRLAHRPQKKHSPRSERSHRNYTGVFRSWLPATCRFSTAGDLLITMVKEAVTIWKRVLKKKAKLVRISHWSDSDENAIDFEIACDCVKRANVVVARKEIFAKTHTATHRPTSAQRLIVTMMTHTLKTVRGALGLWPDGAIKCLSRPVFLHQTIMQSRLWWLLSIGEWIKSPQNWNIP